MWSGIIVPLSWCHVCSVAIVSLPIEGISISWTHWTSSFEYARPGSCI
jgi:hypothetical protein